MKITRANLSGVVTAIVGQGLVLGLTMVVVIALGGGPHADLDAGERFGVLVVGLGAYGIAQLVLLGVCALLSRRIGRGAGWGMTAGWMLGFAATLLYFFSG
ncbi:hypothetical protein [Actinoplanes sp. NPDC020271]|uniref:hypothetical protein n=1 Tax=Actinoplanes sp. NPDC020271 TaxID=3363896 RepID=UPI0037B6AC8A